MGWKVRDATTGELVPEGSDEARHRELHQLKTRVSGLTLVAVDRARGDLSRSAFLRLLIERGAEIQALGEAMVELRETVAKSSVALNIALQVIGGDMAAAEAIVLDTDDLRREYLGKAAGRIHEHQHKLLGGSGVAH